MVEEVNKRNIYIAVSSPNVNLNLTRRPQFSVQISDTDTFKSVSIPVDIQVKLNTKYCKIHRVYSNFFFLSDTVIHLRSSLLLFLNHFSLTNQGISNILYFEAQNSIR